MKKILFFVCMLVAVSVTSAFAEVVVIANESVSATSITKAEVKDIYTGKTTKMGGAKIKVVMYKTGDVHESFMNNVVGESASKVSKIWKKAIFTGTGKPPKIVKTAADMVAYVKANAGAIGYVDSADAGDAKVLAVN